MNAPDTDIRGETAVVHKSVRHDSAVLHVTGAAVYTDDIPEPPGTLHLAPGFCPNLTAGRIRDIDLSRVRSAPGVVAVLTAKDIPGKNDWSSTPVSVDPVIAESDIEFWGQVTFCVVADSHLAAR
jgi:xanthine dehydrogenase large subunit